MNLIGLQDPDDLPLTGRVSQCSRCGSLAETHARFCARCGWAFLPFGGWTRVLTPSDERATAPGKALTASLNRLGDSRAPVVIGSVVALQGLSILVLVTVLWNASKAMARFQDGSLDAQIMMTGIFALCCLWSRYEPVSASVVAACTYLTATSVDLAFLFLSLSGPSRSYYLTVVVLIRTIAAAGLFVTVHSEATRRARKWDLFSAPEEGSLRPPPLPPIQELPPPPMPPPVLPVILPISPPLPVVKRVEARPAAHPAPHRPPSAAEARYRPSVPAGRLALPILAGGTLLFLMGAVLMLSSGRWMHHDWRWFGALHAGGVFVAFWGMAILALGFLWDRGRAWRLVRHGALVLMAFSGVSAVVAVAAAAEERGAFAFSFVILDCVLCFVGWKAFRRTLLEGVDEEPETQREAGLRERIREHRSSLMGLPQIGPLFCAALVGIAGFQGLRVLYLLFSAVLNSHAERPLFTLLELAAGAAAILAALGGLKDARDPRSGLSTSGRRRFEVSGTVFAVLFCIRAMTFGDAAGGGQGLRFLFLLWSEAGLVAFFFMAVVIARNLGRAVPASEPALLVADSVVAEPDPIRESSHELFVAVALGVALEQLYRIDLLFWWNNGTAAFHGHELGARVLFVACLVGAPLSLTCIARGLWLQAHDDWNAPAFWYRWTTRGLWWWSSLAVFRILIISYAMFEEGQRGYQLNASFVWILIFDAIKAVLCALGRRTWKMEMD